MPIKAPPCLAPVPVSLPDLVSSAPSVPVVGCLFVCLFGFLKANKDVKETAVFEWL